MTKDELQIYQMLPLPPSIDARAQDFIIAIIERLGQMGRLDIADIGALTILATEFDKVLKINNLFAEGEPFFDENNGRKNPLLIVQTTSENICLQVMKEFGLTAKARKSLTYRDGQVSESNGVIDEFLK